MRHQTGKAWFPWLIGGLTLTALVSLLSHVAAEEKRSQKPGEREPGPSPAKDFAKTMHQATQILSRCHIKAPNQGELVGWAVQGLYRRLKARMPAALSARLLKVRHMHQAELFNLLSDAYKRLGKCQGLTTKNAISIGLGEVFSRLEPGAKYIPPREWACQFEYIPEGIGVRLAKDGATGQLKLVTPVLNSSAFKAGLHAGDTIITISRDVPVDGPGLVRHETAPTKGLSVADAEKLIAGRPGSIVLLTYHRKGITRPLQAAVIRRKTEPETVFGVRRKADATWDYLADGRNKIALVRLKNFFRHTRRDLSRVLARLDRQGVKGLILDLRSNRGGLLDCSVKVAELFIDEGLIMSIKFRGYPEIPYFGKSAKRYLGLPMVCLVNGGTVQSAEMIAACLQDHRRALIMGERTQGDCGLHTLRYLPNAGLLDFTWALMIRPSGQNLARWMNDGRDSEDWGVIPDKACLIKLSPRERAELSKRQESQEIILPWQVAGHQKNPRFRDRQLEKALSYLRDQIWKTI